MTLTEFWRNRIINEIYPRIKNFTEEEKRFYNGITKKMIYPNEAIDILKPNLTKEQIQFIWDTVCIRENFENNLKIAEIAEKDKTQIRGLSEYI